MLKLFGNYWSIIGSLLGFYERADWKMLSLERGGGEVKLDLED